MYYTISKEDGVNRLTYPDGQPHVKIMGLPHHASVKVLWTIRSAKELLELLEISNALDGLFAHKAEVIIPYLMGARFDRRMEEGDSVDLEVIADMINYCKFDRVTLFDVHSDVALRLIKRSVNIDNSALLGTLVVDDGVLICPDAGAAKKVDSYMKMANGWLTSVEYCIKSRDLRDGKISLKVLEPEHCADRNCVIIDDLCDGGGTFIAIANQINPKTLTLVVSHGIFSKGLHDLKELFTRIITTDSYRSDLKQHPVIRVVPFSAIYQLSNQGEPK